MPEKKLASRIDFELKAIDHQRNKQAGRLINEEYRFGSICPKCHDGVLDYDGLLNLICSICGPVQSGCFT